MPKLHLLGVFHTLHQNSFSHCAFTGKALRFPKMMKQYGYDVIEYSNEGSESEAIEKVQMLPLSQYYDLFPKNEGNGFIGEGAIIGGLAHKCFEEKLVMALRERLGPEDIVCHPFGHAHQTVTNLFPENQHVETGIGYDVLMPGSYKIFESYAWMHYHQGRAGRNGKNYEWVVPNYFDIDEWVPNPEPGGYLAFLGRITRIKGLDTILAVADHSPYPIVICGQGDPDPWKHPNIVYGGQLRGGERSDFLRNARALLAPSTFTEPFCGMAVEAMLCGTPVLSVDYGAMTETVQEGMGFRCHTLKDWLEGIEKVGDLDREWISNKARSLYSLESCGKKYDIIFQQLNNLYRKGWYSLE